MPGQRKPQVFVTPLGGVYETADTSFLYEAIDENGKNSAFLMDLGGNPAPTSDQTEHEARKRFMRIPGAKNIRDLVVTHPHFDHLGGVPIAASEFGLTVHLSEDAYLFLELMAKKQGVKMEDIKTHIFRDDEPFNIGPFKLTPRQCTHSVIGSFGFDIEVCGKTITHMSDNKLTGMSEKTRETNLSQLQKMKDADLLVTDVLYAGQRGISEPEGPVVLALFDLIKQKMQKEVTHYVFMISSNIDRILNLWKLLYANDISVSFEGWAMHNTAHILEKRLQRTNADYALSMIDVPDPKTQVVFGTGNQAEEGSFIHRLVKSGDLRPGDRIYLSSTLIPNDNKAFFAAKIQVMRELLTEAINQGAEVYVHNGQASLFDLHQTWEVAEANIHVSGHGKLGDLKLIVEAKRPKRLLPYHFLHNTQEKLQTLLENKVKVIEPIMGQKIEI